MHTANTSSFLMSWWWCLRSQRNKNSLHQIRNFRSQRNKNRYNLRIHQTRNKCQDVVADRPVSVACRSEPVRPGSCVACWSEPVRPGSCVTCWPELVRSGSCVAFWPGCCVACWPASVRPGSCVVSWPEPVRPASWLACLCGQSDLVAV